jgi:hypothetical protein
MDGRKDGRKYQAMKTVISSPNLICAVALKADPPDAATAPVVSNSGLSRTGAHKFFRAVRVFVSSIVDSSAFQDVSVHQQVAIIFTSNGPLIYRYEPNKDVLNRPARSSKN